MYWLPRSKVLVPTDFSRPSGEAIRSALSMVESGSNVHVLHVARPLPDDLAAADIGSDDERLTDRARVQFCEEKLKEFLEDQGLSGLTRAVEIGEPSLCITRYAREHRIDLIAIAAHGYEDGERIPLGSVTERVLHNADGPVLVLRPDVYPSQTSGSTVRTSTGYSPVQNPSRETTGPASK